MIFYCCCCFAYVCKIRLVKRIFCQEKTDLPETMTEPVTSINGTNKNTLGNMVLGHSSGFSSLLHAARQLFSLPVNSLGTPQFFRSSVISPCLSSLRKASSQFWFFLHTPWQFFRLSVSYLSILLARVQCCFTSTQTVRTTGDREPRTPTWTFTQLLSSGQLFWLDVNSSDVPSIIQTPHQFFRLHVNFSDFMSVLQTSCQVFRLFPGSTKPANTFWYLFEKTRLSPFLDISCTLSSVFNDCQR